MKLLEFKEMGARTLLAFTLKRLFSAKRGDFLFAGIVPRSSSPRHLLYFPARSRASPLIQDRDFETGLKPQIIAIASSAILVK
jgi:hypothetical protein